MQKSEEFGEWFWTSSRIFSSLLFTFGRWESIMLSSPPTSRLINLSTFELMPAISCGHENSFSFPVLILLNVLRLAKIVCCSVHVKISPDGGMLCAEGAH